MKLNRQRLFLGTLPVALIILIILTIRPWADKRAEGFSNYLLNKIDSTCTVWCEEEDIQKLLNDYEKHRGLYEWWISDLKEEYTPLRRGLKNRSKIIHYYDSINGREISYEESFKNIKDAQERNRNHGWKEEQTEEISIGDNYYRLLEISSHFKEWEMIKKAYKK